MKKLMIMAAAAAMAGTVFAVGDAQVYDAKLTVKTTGCVNGKFTKALESFPDKDAPAFNAVKGDSVLYRKQATRKINGVFWGCDCETIASPAWRLYTGVNTKTGADKKPHTVGGYAFWDATKSSNLIPFTIPYVSFEWLVLNRIDQMKSVEGTWILRDRAADEALFLVGAGFGTCYNKDDECASYIKSISGNFAGFLQYASGADDGCVFCGTTDYDCLVAPFCWCQNVLDTTYLTAAYGTWSITYNASNSKTLKKKRYITELSAYSTKAFKSNGDKDAPHPSVYNSLNAEMIALKDYYGLNATSLSGWLKADEDDDEEEEDDDDDEIEDEDYEFESFWDLYVVMDFSEDEDGVQVLKDKKGRVIQKTQTATVAEVLATLNDYLDALDDVKDEVGLEDPGLATEQPEFPASVAKYVDAS